MRPYNTVSTFYVSPACRGTTGQSPVPGKNGDGPFGSIQEALTAVSELRRSGIGQPVTIRLLPGEYEFSAPLTIGPDITNITIESYDAREKAVISGGRKIEGFKADVFNGAECLSAEIGDMKVTDVYVNGERAGKTRYPAEGEENLRMTGYENHDTYLFSPSKWLSGEPEKLAFIAPEHMADAVITFNHYWIDEHSPVEAYSPEDGKITLRYASRFSLTTNFGFIIENVPETFGNPGEAYYDRASGKLYYIPRAGETPESLEVHIPLTGELINVKGTPGDHVRNIRIRGLKIAYTSSEYISAIGVHGEDNGRFASDAQAVSNCRGTVNFEYADNCAVAKCDIVNYGLYGVNIDRGCSEIRVARDRFFDGGAGGVRINGATAIEIDADPSKAGDVTHDNGVCDCTISHCGRVHMAGCGVLIMNSFNNRVAHNDIGDLFYTGVSCGWVWGYSKSITRDNLILKNHIHDLGQGVLSDMGGVYLLGAQPGTVVANNVIHVINSHDYGGWALYTDEGSGYITLENNICYDCNDNCYHQHYGRMNTVRNNIFAFAGGQLCRVS
ncbi:MAG: right-handed parallel beta-helix repeat-containing protein, partial [Lachnospiraceae bacterium]|nr:right-handed parallel beta-helix repeat-containing protein [Lachnospiraceae bacterium]